ncbi:MAG TPA: ATP-binding protein, partial [Sphingobacteriaceae bacterium]
MSKGQTSAEKLPFASVISSLPGNYIFLLPDVPDFTIVEATDQYCAVTFTDKDALIGQPLFKVFPEVIRPGEKTDSLRATLTELVETKTSSEIPLHQYNIFNPVLGVEEDRYWSFINVPVLDDQGEVSLIIHKVTDKTVETSLRISEQKAHQSLQVRERFYQMLMQAPLAMCILEGPDMVISSANNTILKLWDISPDVIGRSLLEVLPEFRDRKNSHDILRAFKTGEMVYGYEEPFTILTDDGEREVFLNYVCQPIRENGTDTVTAVLVMVYDVTRQVMATRVVAESENKLRRLIDQSVCAISFLNGRDLIIDIANEPAMKALRGGPEIIGKSLLDLLKDPYDSRMKTVAEEVLETGKTHKGHEVRWHNNPDDPAEERFYTYTISPLRTGGQIAGTIITATDVTDDVQMKRKLQEEEERLQTATRAAELGLWDYNFQTGAITLDKRCRELYDLPEDAEVDYGLFVSLVQPDDRNMVEEALLVASDPDGTGTYDVEHRTISVTERWLRSVGKVFFDENRDPARFVGTVLEITAKKQEEIRKNDFTAMASHELKTPLTSIKAYIQILSNTARKFNDSFLSGSLAKVEIQLNKMTKMINDFLDLSRMESGRFAMNMEDFELNDLIEEVLDEVRPIINTHTVSFTRQADVFLHGDRQKIGEVIQNFLSNAAKYSPNSKLITLRVTTDVDHVSVSVTDRGIGISPDDQQRVFQRFFRSQKATLHGFSGFGIGLYISAEIIQRHGGIIGVNSEEDAGSEFYFSLPRQAAPG